MTKLAYQISLRPVGDGVMEATGGTDGRVVMGPKGTPNAFTPVELLLAAIAGCSGIDLHTVSKNAGVDPGAFELHVRATRPIDQNRLTDIRVEYVLPGVDAATAESLAAQAEALCTVSITVKHGCQIETVVRTEASASASV